MIFHFHRVDIRILDLSLSRKKKRKKRDSIKVAKTKEWGKKLMRFKSRIPVSPTCKPNQTKVHGVAKQEKANISCQVDANPPEVQFRWTFNNSAESIDVAASHIARAGTSSIVSYTPMTELDYGTLLCWATNRIGHQQVPCVYHIIPAGEVSLP